MAHPPTAHSIELHPYFEPDILEEVRVLDLKHQQQDLRELEDELQEQMEAEQAEEETRAYTAALNRVCMMLQQLRCEVAEQRETLERLLDIVAGGREG